MTSIASFVNITWSCIIVRIWGFKNNIKRLFTHWYGKLFIIFAIIMIFRFVTSFTITPDPSSSTKTTSMNNLTIFSIICLVTVLYLLRVIIKATYQPSIIMAPGDLCIVDSLNLVKPIILAGLLFKIIVASAITFIFTLIMINLLPNEFPSLNLRMSALLSLSAITVNLSLLAITINCLNKIVQRLNIRIIAYFLCLCYISIVLFKFYSKGVGVIMDFGKFFLYLAKDVSVILILCCCASLCIVQIIFILSVSKRMLPRWAKPLYQIAYIYDVAQTKDLNAALALNYNLNKTSYQFCDYFKGGKAFLFKDLIESTRRKRLLAVFIQSTTVFVISYIITSFLPNYWWLCMLIIGNFIVANSIQETATLDTKGWFINLNNKHLLSHCIWSIITNAIITSFLMIILTIGLLIPPHSVAKIHSLMLVVFCWSSFTICCIIICAVVTLYGKGKQVRKITTYAVSAFGPILFIIIIANFATQPLFELFTSLGITVVISIGAIYLTFSITSSLHLVRYCTKSRIHS